MFRWPSILIFIGMAIGVTIASYISFSNEIWLSLFAVNILVLFILHFRNSLKFPYLFWIILLSASITLGGGLLIHKNSELQKQNQSFFNKDQALVKFRLVQKQKTTQFYKKWFVQVESIENNNKLLPVHTKILLQYPQDKSYSLDFKHSYYAVGKMKKISKAQAPFGFDYSNYMKQNSILYQITVDSIIEGEQISSFSYKNQYLNLLRRIDASDLSKEAKETLKALTLADRTDMDPDSLKVFSLAGIIHLFAISGLHIGLLFGLIYAIFVRVFGYRNRKMAIFISLVLVTLYGAFIQFPTSVSRAIIMLFSYYGFQMFQRPSLPYHSLAMAGIVLLILNPYHWFEVGFQLSFAAVFFILWLYPTFKRMLRKWNHKLRDITAVTLSAQLGTVPLSLLYFHQLSWIGLFLNLLIIPFAGILVMLSFLNLLVLTLFPEFQWNITLYNSLCEGFYGITKYAASLNTSFFQNISFTWWEVFGLWALIMVIPYLFKSRSNKKWVLFFGLLSLFLATRLMVNINQFNKSEIVIYNEYKNTVISAKKGNRMVYWSKAKLDSSFQEYKIKPYWLHRRKPNLTLRDLTFQKMKIESIPIYLVENELPNQTEKNSIIILKNSPKADWKELLALPFAKIILDGSNYPNYVDDFLNFAKEMKIESKVWATSKQGYFFLPL